MARITAAFLLLIALGLGVSGYLLARHYTLVTTSGPVAPSTCAVLLKRDCDGALQSPASAQLGLPLAAWGVVYYGTLAGLVALGWLLGDFFRFEAALLATVLAAVGAALSVALFATMVWGRAPFCPLCAATHAINLLLLPVCVWLTGRSVRQVGRAIGAGVAAVFGGRTAGEAAGRVKLLGGLTAALIAAALYQWLVIQERRHPPARFDVNKAVVEFALTARADIPVADDDPRLGPDDAWVRVVVFTDFQCPGCRRLAADLGPMVEAYRPRVQLVFKHFPANRACNPAVKDDPHPRACEAAWAADAARRQDKFWPLHDALFATSLDSDRAVSELARQAGLDLGRFEADRAGEAVRAKVRADVELGTRLGVDETPAVFVNGRRAPDVRLRSVDLFVLSEMASRSPAAVRAPKAAGGAQ